MSVYIAGPIRGVEDYRERFAAAEAVIRVKLPEGTRVMNPAKLPVGMLDAWYMERCCRMVCRANAIIVMGGWRHKSAVLIEILLAEYCGVPVIWFEDLGELCCAGMLAGMPG